MSRFSYKRTYESREDDSLILEIFSLISFVGGLLVFIGGMLVVGILLRGWVLKILWGWFITPTFAGAPKLGIPQAIGISLIANLLVPRFSNSEDERKRSLTKGLTSFVTLVFAPLLMLGVGWVVHQYM